MPTKPHQIAIHEAAHATLAVVQGLGFKGAKLGDSPIVPLDHRLNRCAGKAENEIIARFLLGGFCGERRFYPTLCNPQNSVARYQLAIRNVASELLERNSLNPMQIATLLRKS